MTIIISYLSSSAIKVHHLYLLFGSLFPHIQSHHSRSRNRSKKRAKEVPENPAFLPHIRPVRFFSFTLLTQSPPERKRRSVGRVRGEVKAKNPRQCSEVTAQPLIVAPYPSRSHLSSLGHSFAPHVTHSFPSVREM